MSVYAGNMLNETVMSRDTLAGVLFGMSAVAMVCVLLVLMLIIVVK